MPALGALLELPLTIQLQSESGECYEAIFSSAGASLNTTTIFKGQERLRPAGSRLGDAIYGVPRALKMPRVESFFTTPDASCLVSRHNPLSLCSCARSGSGRAGAGNP